MDDDKSISLGWANESKLSAEVKRRFSEPDTKALTTPSADGSLSPSSTVNTQIKCNWCSKNFDAPGKGAKSAYEALDKHLAAAHPDQQSATSLSSFDGAAEEEQLVDEAAIEADDEVNDHESPLDATNTAIPTASATDFDDLTPDVDSLPLLGTEANKDLQTKLHGVVRQKRHAFLEDRLNTYWNIHDAPAFSTGYDNETANLEHMWDYVYQLKKKTLNKNGAADNIPPRPSPYQCSKVDKGDFLKLTAVENFLEPLKNFESMPTDELHVMAANIAHALKSWQDEWLAIEKLGKTINGRSAKKSANPRALDPPDVFRDKREATLYGYKYDPTIHDPKKRDAKKDSLFRVQDPFIQGGFRPTAAQLRKMQVEAGSNNPNPDGFKTMQKYGQEWAPKFQDPPLHRFDGGMMMTRKRKVPQSEVAALKQMSGNDSATPAGDSDADGRPYKRATRSIKVVDPPQVKTAPPSPGPRGRGRGGRGGRGRGGTSRGGQPGHSNLAHIASSTAITEPQADATVSNNGLEAGSARSRTMTSTPPSETPTPRQPSVASGQGQANIAPAPKPALAPATPGAPPALAALPPNLVQPGEVVDPDELNRRRLIAKSKNPRRTQAMLDHWKRFNSEGRTRNPKRTKAQIEADKRAESERRAHDPPKEPTKIRKRKTTTVPATDNLAGAQVRASSSSGPTMSLQPAPIQPAVAPLPISTAAPPPTAISLPPPNFSSAPPAPQSPQRLPPHNPVPPPPPSARPLPSVLPSIESSVGHSAWNNPPPRYYQYPLPNMLPGYTPYNQQPQFPPPPPPPHGGFQLPRHDPGPPADTRPPNPPPYGYDAPPPHIHNRPHMPPPQGERRP
ncbi:hypothetical protein PISL3812_07288 [Talaromyces islandicus]|uniref:Uncharacterized protein n=1 Tax=Talaromyces islandicus TaxID=28573 RepID=A0A0U1M3W1_TALIS|nr:hypothetical protein PISL3812_07288 [Talaromyces islandicus]